MTTDTLNFLGACVTLLVLVLPFLLSLASAVANHFNVRLPENLDATLANTARQAVNAAEQLSTVAKTAGGIAPDDRKQYAVNAMQTILQHFHIKVSPDVLSTYIEDAVRLLPSSGFNSTAAGTVAQPTAVQANVSAPETVNPMPGITATVTGDTPTQTVATVPST